MRKLTDIEWAHVRNVVDASCEGKAVQGLNGKKWQAISCLNVHALMDHPSLYRVKPEPLIIEVPVYRNDRTKEVLVGCPPPTDSWDSWPLLYTFKHEVQQ